jgi:hypothetical protein
MYSEPMKGYRVAEARARFGELLDEAESGNTVMIERRGVRFFLEAERAPAAAARRRVRGPLEYVHPDVMSGNWTWTWGPRGLRFKGRRRRA